MRPSIVLVCLALAGCPSSTGSSTDGDTSGAGGDSDISATGWQRVFDGLGGMLISVWGRNANDIWAVGFDAQDGAGPLVLHYDGTSWERMETGTGGALWWVHGFGDTGPVYMAGSTGKILSYENNTFTVMSTPTTATLFGLWGSGPDDLWAVGGDANGTIGAGVILRNQGAGWEDVTADLPAGGDTTAFFKVWGRSATDITIVGFIGRILHFNGSVFTVEESNTTERLATVFVPSATTLPTIAVGGIGVPVLLEKTTVGWVDGTPLITGGLFGIWVTDDDGYITGDQGRVMRRVDGNWVPEETGFESEQLLHAVWIDDLGEVWAVGGNLFGGNDGIMLHLGDPVGSRIE